MLINSRKSRVNVVCFFPTSLYISKRCHTSEQIQQKTARSVLAWTFRAVNDYRDPLTYGSPRAFGPFAFPINPASAIIVSA